MYIREITPLEYGLLQGRLDDLDQEQAMGLRNRLNETYYAYLDKAVQLKKAVQAYEEVTALIEYTADRKSHLVSFVNNS